MIGKAGSISGTGDAQGRARISGGVLCPSPMIDGIALVTFSDTVREIANREILAGSVNCSVGTPGLESTLELFHPHPMLNAENS